MFQLLHDVVSGLWLTKGDNEPTKTAMIHGGIGIQKPQIMSVWWFPPPKLEWIVMGQDHQYPSWLLLTILVPLKKTVIKYSLLYDHSFNHYEPH